MRQIELNIVKHGQSFSCHTSTTGRTIARIVQITAMMISICLIFLPSKVYTQAVRVDVPLLTSGPNVPVTGGPLPQALWVANSTAYICTHPSITLAACQASPITTYTDSTAGTPCLAATPLVQLPGSTCTASTGITSNLGFWYSGGTVDYWIVSSYGTYGPFSVNSGGATLPVAPGGAGWVSNAAPNSTGSTPVAGWGKKSCPGIVNDGVTDNTAAINACVATGQKYYYPTVCDPPNGSLTHTGVQGQIYFVGPIAVTQSGAGFFGGNVGTPSLPATNCPTVFAPATPATISAPYTITSVAAPVLIPNLGNWTTYTGSFPAGWAGRVVTISGFTGGYIGNNGTFVIQSSFTGATGTTITVNNPNGVAVTASGTAQITTGGAFIVKAANDVTFQDLEIVCPTASAAGTIGIDLANSNGAHYQFAGGGPRFQDIVIRGCAQALYSWGYQNGYIDSSSRTWYAGANNPGDPTVVIAGNTPNEWIIPSLQVMCDAYGGSTALANYAIEFSGGYGWSAHIGDSNLCSNGGVAWFDNGVTGDFYIGDSESGSGSRLYLSNTASPTIHTNQTDSSADGSEAIITSDGSGNSAVVIGFPLQSNVANNAPTLNSPTTNTGATACSGATRWYTMNGYNPTGVTQLSNEVSATPSAGGSVTLTWGNPNGGTYQYYIINEGATSGGELMMTTNPVIQGNVVTFTDTCALTPSGAPPTVATLRYPLFAKQSNKDDITAALTTAYGSFGTNGTAASMVSSTNGEMAVMTDHCPLYDSFNIGSSSGWYNRFGCYKVAGQISTGTADQIVYTFWGGAGVGYTGVDILHSYQSVTQNQTAATATWTNSGVPANGQFISNLTSTTGVGVNMWLNNASPNGTYITMKDPTTATTDILLSHGVVDFNVPTYFGPTSSAAATVTTPINSVIGSWQSTAWCGAGASTPAIMRSEFVPTAGLNAALTWELLPQVGACTGPIYADLSQAAAGTKVTGLISAGTRFTTNAGCSETIISGGATAGRIQSGTTGTCTFIVTMGSGATSPAHWECWVADRTTVGDTINQTGDTATTVTFSGTTVSGDSIRFACTGTL